jgi:hypothetical protein
VISPATFGGATVLESDLVQIPSRSSKVSYSWKLGLTGGDDGRLDALEGLDRVVGRELAVLDGLAAALGNGKDGSSQPAGQEALLVHAALAQVALERLVHVLGERAAAAARIDVHPIALVAVDERLLPIRQLVCVLVHVAGVDGEEHLVVREDVDAGHPGLPAGRRLGDAAGPLRDRPLGVARPLGTHGSEVLPQTRDLIFGRNRERGQRAGQQSHTEQRDRRPAHENSSLPDSIASVVDGSRHAQYRKLRFNASQSRSWIASADPAPKKFV